MRKKQREVHGYCRVLVVSTLFYYYSYYLQFKKIKKNRCIKKMKTLDYYLINNQEPDVNARVEELKTRPRKGDFDGQLKLTDRRGLSRPHHAHCL